MRPIRNFPHRQYDKGVFGGPADFGHADLRRLYDSEMADLKPPRLAGDELATLHSLLGYQRESLVRKVAGLDEMTAQYSPVASGTSLLWLMKHLARAETLWLLHRFAGQDVDLPPDALQIGDTLGGAVAEYRLTWQRADMVIAGAESLDQLCRRNDDLAPVNLRFVLAHLLEETARHCGHADIIREMIDGETGR